MRSLRSIPTALLSLGARRVNLSPPVFHLLYPWHDDTVAAVLSALRIDKPLVMIVLRVRACTSAPHCLRREGGGESWYRIAPYIYISIWAWGGDRLKNREKDRESIVSFFGEKNCCKWGGKIFFFTGEFGRFIVEILKVDLKIYHEFGRISKSFCGIFIYITSKDFFFSFFYYFNIVPRRFIFDHFFCFFLPSFFPCTPALLFNFTP